MKVKFERFLFCKEQGLHLMRKGEPWDTARITLREDNKYISFLFTRKKLLSSEFKQYYKKAKQKLLDKQE